MGPPEVPARHKGSSRLMTQLIHLDRYIDFEIRFAEFLDEKLEYCAKALPGADQSHTNRIGHDLQEIAEKCQHFARNQAHQMECIHKRMLVMTNIIYTVNAQRDSRTNVRIARAARLDNSVTVISLLTMLFLPATFTSSLFSMDMFDFQAPQGKRVVSPRFW